MSWIFINPWQQDKEGKISFLVEGKLNWNRIVFTLLRLIWNQKTFNCVQNFKIKKDYDREIWKSEPLGQGWVWNKDGGKIWGGCKIEILNTNFRKRNLGYTGPHLKHSSWNEKHIWSISEIRVPKCGALATPPHTGRVAFFAGGGCPPSALTRGKGGAISPGRARRVGRGGRGGLYARIQFSIGTHQI